MWFFKGEWHSRCLLGRGRAGVALGGGGRVRGGRSCCPENEENEEKEGETVKNRKVVKTVKAIKRVKAIKTVKNKTNSKNETTNKNETNSKINKKLQNR